MFKKINCLRKLRNEYGSSVKNSLTVADDSLCLEVRVSLNHLLFRKKCEQFPLEVKFVEDFQKQNGEEFAVEVKFFPRS